MLLSWPQLVGQADQSGFFFEFKLGQSAPLFLMCGSGLWDVTQVISGPGAESLTQCQGWDGQFLPCVWRNKASLQREKAGVDMQSQRQETKTPERQCSSYYQSLCYRLSLLQKLKAGPLTCQPPLQLESAMLFTSDECHGEVKAPGEDFFLAIEGTPLLGESFLPFSPLLCLLFVSWISDLELEQPFGDHEAASKRLKPTSKDNGMER